ncbi:NADP-dependent oxidoreductase domain-containing protein [Podospora fimiseda]|uniref:NADP-dependent oxidoreductase domain-containing protein n=1 Tax=Podospora fimiseda TaxID=252190 RepID=A0AAN6YQD2_9PEZI|nr:NADP-dependent oxidoreductase domain-containing protein [Podospora fimiseda]
MPRILNNLAIPLQSYLPLIPNGPPAKTLLARYRLLSPTASIWVSPLCLGSLNFGNAWKDFLGECTSESTEEILDHFFSQGGNFIDTSNNYQFEQAETRIGNWMKKHNNRDQLVIATKYSTNYQTLPSSQPQKQQILVNYTGNGNKSLTLSVEASLKKLQTSYIDILYVHWYDFSTSIPELMHSLNRLVLSGKVLYLGISDTPAWVVSKANEYARCNGLRQFVVYQGKWSAATRDFERDILPMCKADGMGIAPWGVLGGGQFFIGEGKTEGRKWGQTETEKKVSEVLAKIAEKKGCEISGVALAYVASKTPYVFPIVGCRTLKHLEGNIKGLEVTLSGEEIKEIEGAVPEFDLGFPMNFMYLGSEGVPENKGEVFTMSMGGTLDHVGEVKGFARE